MFCCDLKPTVADRATGLKKSALEEVRGKRILDDAQLLLKCANPYGIENMVITEERSQIEIHWYGDLVFCWYNGLKRYVCGDWTDILSDQAEAIKAQRRQIKSADRLQRIANNAALRNYVVR